LKTDSRVSELIISVKDRIPDAVTRLLTNKRLPVLFKNKMPNIKNKRNTSKFILGMAGLILACQEKYIYVIAITITGIQLKIQHKYLPISFKLDFIIKSIQC